MEKALGIFNNGHSLSLLWQSQEGIFLKSSLWKSGTVPGGKTPKCVGIFLRLCFLLSLGSMFNLQPLIKVFEYSYSSWVQLLLLLASKSIVFIWMHLSLQFVGSQFVLGLHFSRGSEKNYWFSIFLVFPCCKDESDQSLFMSDLKPVLLLHIKHIHFCFHVWSSWPFLQYFYFVHVIVAQTSRKLYRYSLNVSLVRGYVFLQNVSVII